MIDSKSCVRRSGVIRPFWTCQKHCLRPATCERIIRRDAKPQIAEVGLEAGGVRPN